MEYLKKPNFWLKNNLWNCARPRKPLIKGMSYKTHGLIGRGKTTKEAYNDLLSWERCSDFVASIY